MDKQTPCLISVVKSDCCNADFVKNPNYKNVELMLLCTKCGKECTVHETNPHLIWKTVSKAELDALNVTLEAAKRYLKFHTAMTATDLRMALKVVEIIRGPKTN